MTWNFRNSTNASENQELLNEYLDTVSASVIPVITFIGLISLVGSVGNCVVIYIYSSKYPKCNFKHFVLLLAGLDLVSCAILMPLEIVTFVTWFSFPTAWLCKGKSFLNAFTVSSSALSLLLIAIDRFKKVCKPHGKQMQPEFATKLSILVLVIAVVPATSDAVFWGLHTFKLPYKGKDLSVVICEKDDAYKNTIWPTLHTAVLYAGTNVVVMIVTMTLYICIAVKLFCVSISSSPSNSPKITVSGPDGEMLSPSKDENAFQFPSDIETGFSESDDASKSIDDGVFQDRNSNLIEEEEAIPLRNTAISDVKNESKSVRISTEIKEESQSNSIALELPVIQARKKLPMEKSPRSPTAGRLNRRRRSSVASIGGYGGTRLRRKTLIMFILTAIFVGTTLLYLIMISIMSHSNHLVHKFSVQEIAAWLFFLRLYFVNSVINPILYGFLDPRFKRVLWNMGIHISWYAGSLKKNISNTIRRTASGRVVEDVVVRRPTRPESAIRSSTTMS